MAICGGVNCVLMPSIMIPLSKARMVSPTGSSKAFSAEADGYARGEGAGIVILKKLADVSSNHNTIYHYRKLYIRLTFEIIRPKHPQTIPRVTCDELNLYYVRRYTCHIGCMRLGRVKGVGKIASHTFESVNVYFR